MGELEEKGYLYHPHTSAGRIPTDRAYRWYVNNLAGLAPPSSEDQRMLTAELGTARSALEEILRRAAQVLGVLTNELGVAVAPAFDQVVLEKIDLTQVSTERLLLVFHLKSGAVRTIFVQVSGHLPADTVGRVAQTLNERLAGLSLQEIRTTLGERLRDAERTPGDRELLNIFIEEGRRSSASPPGPTRWCWGAPRCWRGSRSSPPADGSATCWTSPSGATCCSRPSPRGAPAG
ncbi:MAG: hypothetical protein IPO73_15825 [Gemmatimonadetes bacterium]|nr:hypothetical protein [Gemmatimonadota bacterium]